MIGLFYHCNLPCTDLLPRCHPNQIVTTWQLPAIPVRAILTSSKKAGQNSRLSPAKRIENFYIDHSRLYNREIEGRHPIKGIRISRD